MSNRNRGFTLIELLVVIAIIGILSSVVLASLNTARAKGNDAKVKAQLANLRTAAAIYYDNNSSSYTASTMSAAALPCTGTMFTDTTSGMNSFTGTATAWPGSTTLWCNASTAAWVVQANLSTAGQYWCVDSTGVSRSETAQITGTSQLACS